MMTNLFSLEMYNLMITINNISTMCFPIGTCEWFPLAHLQTILTKHKDNDFVKHFQLTTLVNVFEEVVGIEEGFAYAGQHSFTFENVYRQRHLA